MILANEREIERLKIMQQMLCKKDFSVINCSNCDYFYYQEDDINRYARCLKKSIKDWTLYQIDKGR